MMMVLDALIREFNGHVAFRERRRGVLQVLAPLFYEDVPREGLWKTDSWTVFGPSLDLV